MTSAPPTADPHSAPQAQLSAPPAVAAKSGGRRLYALDGMRLLAALSVLSFHWLAYVGISGIWKKGDSPKQVLPALNHLAAYGWLGVELFFVISGFVICMSCWGRSVGDFFSSRVVRLYPAYWAGIALTSTVVLALPTLARHGAGNGLNARTIVANLTMLEAPLDVRYVDGVYWTLWSELRFYVLFAIVVAFGLTYRRVVAFCAVWTVASVLVPANGNSLLTTIFQPTSSPYFIAGMAMFLMYKFGPNLLLWGIVAISWALAVVHIDDIKGTYTNVLGHGLNSDVIALVITLAFAMVLAAALGYLDWAKWKWLTVAGALTYPLYLIHQEVGWTLIHGLQKAGLPVPVLLVIALLVVGVTAWLIHRLIERPLSKALKGSLKRSMVSLRRASAEPVQVKD